MPAMRCPTLVGRSAETAALSEVLAAARGGRGRTVVVAGPAGIGKSRLAREAATAARTLGMPVVVGRAVEARDSTAFRPLTEALHAGLRRAPALDLAELEAFRPALGRLLPQWRRPGDLVEESLAVLGEAVLRLFAALAGGTGLLVVLDDLQWADVETLAVLEYVADNVAEERVVVLGTVREHPAAAHELAHRLAARDACTLLTLRPLDRPALAEMAAAWSGVAEDAVVDALERRTDGTPLLVEELLAAGGDPASSLPATVAGLVARRLAALPPIARRCVEAAAVLGERFEWTLLEPVLGLDGRTVREGLRTALAEGIVDADGDGFGFHHALGRDAVVACLLPPERVDLARQALDAVVAAHPGLENGWCDVAVDLALTAGEKRRAAEVLLEAGRRNLARGALSSAATVLGRARDLLVTDDGAADALTAEVDDLLGEALALAGHTDDAAAVTTAAIERLPGLPDEELRLTEAYLRLTTVHETAGNRAAADRALDAARVHAERRGDADLRLRVEAVAARVALDASHFAEARARAEAALAGPPPVACDALFVLGRLARREDPRAAEQLFARARRIADDAGLVVTAARALREESISDVQESLRVDRLQQARLRARAVGDLATVAVLDLQLTAVHLTRWEVDDARASAAASVAASRRFRLATLPKALVLGAGGDFYAGRGEAAEAALAEAAVLAPDDTHLQGEVWGIRAQRALADADDARATAHLRRAMAAFTLRPNEVTGSPAVGLWILLGVVVDRDRRTAPTPPDPVANRWNRGLATFADAVLVGRAGDGVGAAARFAEADAVLRHPVDAVVFRLLARRLVASAALADGWGDPATWAAEDLTAVVGRGEERWAAALRGLLRRSGAVVPRRGRGDTPVPAALRATGVTGRETDVLLLLAEGCANREIAERLHLSPRTVEKHVERLLAKTGLAHRGELVSYASRTLTRPAPGPS